MKENVDRLSRLDSYRVALPLRRKSWRSVRILVHRRRVRHLVVRGPLPRAGNHKNGQWHRCSGGSTNPRNWPTVRSGICQSHSSRPTTAACSAAQTTPGRRVQRHHRERVAKANFYPECPRQWIHSYRQVLRSPPRDHSTYGALLSDLWVSFGLGAVVDGRRGRVVRGQ